MNGSTLKSKLEMTGMTFSEIAKRAGISAQILQSVFAAKNVSSEKLEIIASAVGWTMGQLYGEGTNMAIGDSATAGDHANLVTAEALTKALDEIAAQRKIVERLVTIIENKNWPSLPPHKKNTKVG